MLQLNPQDKPNTKFFVRFGSIKVSHDRLGVIKKSRTCLPFERSTLPISQAVESMAQVFDRRLGQRKKHSG